MGLLWMSAVVAAATALCGWILAGRLDGLYLDAVEEGWAQLFTGEVDELSLIPVSVALYLGFLACINATVATVLCRLRNSAGRARLVMKVGTGISAILLAWTSASVILLRDGQYVHDLYGWWFVPVFFAAAGLYGCLLVGAQFMILRDVPSSPMRAGEKRPGRLAQNR